MSQTVTASTAAPKAKKAAQRRIPLWSRLLIGPVIAVIAIYMVSASLVSPYFKSVFAIAAVYGVIVLSVSLLAGWSGVWSMGQPAMVAIGAYTAGYGSSHGWSLEVVLVVAMAIAAVSGAFLGFAGSRFSILYIALLTLAFNLVVIEIIIHWSEVTGGDVGIPVATLTSITGLFTISSGGVAAGCFAIGAAGVIASLAVLARRTSGRRRMTAAKSHPIAARTLGIAPEAQVTYGFAISAAIGAVGGVLYAVVGGWVSEDSASTAFGVELIAATVLGGVGSIIGSVLGGVYLAFSPSLANLLHLSQPILQGLILILSLLLLRKGLAEPIGRLIRRPFRLAQQDAMATKASEKFSLPPRDVATGDSDLKISDLTVRFGGLKALSDIGFEIDRGQVVCIIGPNGAGKTTFFNVLSGLLPKKAVSGHVTYESSDLRATRATGRTRLGIARTFQHAELFSELTVLQNVLSSRRATSQADIAKAMNLLELLNLDDIANEFPDQLAFGARKRIDLARAVFSQPQLLLMDEPFGGLDNAERQVMGEAIRWVRDQGVTIVVIDHVLDDLRAIADRFIAFDFGTVLKSGTPAEVLADPAVIAAYLGGESSRAARPTDRDLTEAEPLVTLRDVDFRYGSVHALEGVDLTIRRGEIVAVVGANGAGKSTVGKVLHGVLKGSGERVVATKRLRTSLAPEGRGLFNTLSIKENLEVAGYAAGLSRNEIRTELARWSDWLPERVRSRMTAPAGALSGGEQQMVAIARALMAKPDVLILDEPALGLAPNLVDEVYNRILELSGSGLTVVVLEQLLSRAMSVSDTLSVLRDGRIVYHGSPDEPDFETRAETAYFGFETDVIERTQAAE